ncbi:MAG: hypothetical protein U5M23_09960 [Marinagarivorans sp.]|nr:hypothetical protein [Marinagarivorans sp.]
MAALELDEEGDEERTAVEERTGTLDKLELEASEERAGALEMKTLLDVLDTDDGVGALLATDAKLDDVLLAGKSEPLHPKSKSVAMSVTGVYIFLSRLVLNAVIERVLSQFVVSVLSMGPPLNCECLAVTKWLPKASL